MDERVQRELLIAAEIDTLWRAITREGWLSSWLADEVTIELAPGGSLRCVVDGEQRDGWVEEVTPPNGDGAARLVFWWERDADGASRVQLDLQAAGQGARLRVVETRPLEALHAVSTYPIPRGNQAGPTLVAA